MMQYPKLVEVKTLANKVATIEWNPGMDLLATVFGTKALTCSRLLSLQKVWHKQSSGKITSIAWRPDGRVLAIAAFNDKTKENVCTLHDVENGKKVNSIVKDKAITSVDWFQYVPDSNNESAKETKKISNSMATNASSDTFSHQLAHEQTQLSILVISTEDGRVSFHALGLFYLGYVVMHNESASKLVKTHMSSCLRYITSIVNTKHSNVTMSSLKVLKLDTFNRRSNEILRVAKMYAKITDELEYLDDTMTAITTSWADVLAGLDSKLSTYCSRKNKRPNESRGGYTFLSADELLQLLVIGNPSDNLEKFLTDMSDKGLKKLNNAIEQTCLRVQNLIVKNAQKCCYHLHNDLNLLRGMSLWRERFEEVGLDDKFIVNSMRSVGSLVLKLTELQQVIDHSLKSTKSFFRWLISIAFRMSGEQNNSAVPNDINKTTQQDIQLITDFILENFDYNSNQDDLDVVSSSNFLCSGDNESASGGDDGIYSNRPTCSNFTLEQVGQYLKNEPLSRQKYSFIKPDSNFWIEFYKQRPELIAETNLGEDGSSVLLFYQHHAETSLIQEHRKTCKSIESAFESVATNFKSVLNNNDDFVNLKHFLKNAPASRIRIETDLKMQQHLTLFQTKPEPVDKQYMLAQSLEDKIFRLLSIEFVAVASKQATTSRSSTASGSLLITDSGFYDNRETKRLLATFLLLDQSLGDTLIVQVEVEKLLENSVCIDRIPKETAKIFRSNETIDKHSFQIILELDIYTEPACERKNDLDVVVKKIKSTTGKDMYSSSGRGVIAFTSCGNKRLHLYELETVAGEPEIMDDEVEEEEKIDESLIDTDCIG